MGGTAWMPETEKQETPVVSEANAPVLETENIVVAEVKPETEAKTEAKTETTTPVNS